MENNHYWQKLNLSSLPRTCQARGCSNRSTHRLPRPPHAVYDGHGEYIYLCVNHGPGPGENIIWPGESLETARIRWESDPCTHEEQAALFPEIASETPAGGQIQGLFDWDEEL